VEQAVAVEDLLLTHLQALLELPILVAVAVVVTVVLQGALVALV
jgi:hypothetical protein